MTVARRYYPTLSTIVTKDDLPEVLGFIADGINDLLEKMHYKDLQYNKSPKGDAAHYSLSIVTKDRLDIKIPGTEIYIILNPDDDDNAISAFPIMIDYEWKILAYLRDFNVSNFSFSPDQVFEIALRALNISEKDAIAHFINTFVEPASAAVTPLEQFVQDINSANGLTIPAPTSTTELGEILQEIYEQSGENYGSIVAFGTYILQAGPDDTKAKLKEFFQAFLPEDIEAYVKDIIIPKLKTTLELSAAIEFPRKVLQPVYDENGDNPYDDNDNGDVYEVIPPDAEGFPKVQLNFGEAFFYIDTQKGLGYQADIALSTNVPAMIGKTGLIIDIDNLKIDLSNKTNLPEADLDGRPPDFMGVYIEQLSIILPKKWFDIEENDPGTTAGLVGRNLLIGTGGFSGNVALEAFNNTDSPKLYKKIGGNGFKLGFESFDMTFVQNAITNTNIKGSITIPGFKDVTNQDAEIEIIANLDIHGNFEVTAKETQGIQILEIPNILTINLKSLSVGKRDDRFYVAVSGNLDFAQKGGAIGQFLPQDVEITKLIIWSDGTFEIEGGALVLPKAITIPIGPVKLSITALHFGSDERNGVKYKYVGFDGGISINPAGVDARGDGIKYYFTEDGSDHFFRIEGIGIDLTLPGNVSEDKAALLLSGYLAVREGGANGVEYAGNVAFSLPRLNMGGSAGMRYMPDVPAFLVNVGLEIANPIPLGSTGLGIYGFEALFGRHFVVSKEEAGLSADAPWFEYYKMPQRGINNDKFYPIGGTSMGAGVMFGTSVDAGFTFSSRLFFLLSLPGVFFLEGEAQVLKKRIGFASQNTPPFYAFLAITDSSIEAALGVDYKLPDSGGNAGDIAEVTGALELGFFFGNSNGWYINIGRDLPETKRIQAKLLRIINRAYFYFMLSASGIRTGAGAGMKIDKKFGPARVKVEAYLDLAGRLSFRPLQVGGSIRAGIEGSVSIFGVGIGIGAHFALSVDAPKPFVIAGEVKVCVKLLFVKKCAKVKFKWTFGDQLNVVQIPLLNSESVNALNVHTGESYPLAFDTSTSDMNVIPLDSYVDIEFKHAINPLATANEIGGITETPKFRELLPPKKSKAPQLTYEFEVTNVTLSPNDVFADIPGATISGDPKIGFWQWNAPGHYTKIRLLSLSPMSFMNSGVPNGPSWSEDYAVLNMDCFGQLLDLNCLNLDLVGANGLIPSQAVVTSQGIGFQLSDGTSGTVGGGAIHFNAGQSLTIYLASPTAVVHMSAGTETNALIVKYYQSVADDNLIYTDVLVRTDELTAPGSHDIIYDEPEIPINKIVLETGACGTRGDGGGASEEDLPCTPEVMGDLVGLINGLHKASNGIPKEPLQVNTLQWIPLLYKYLMGDSFNMCTTPKDGGGSGNLLEDLLNTLPDVVVTYLPFDNYYGQYKIEIKGCVTFYLKFFLSREYLGRVICFECLKFPGKWNDGLFYFTGEAVLNGDKTRPNFRACISVEFPGDSTYGEPEECESELFKFCYQSLEDFQYNEIVTQTNSVNTTGDDVNILNSSVGQVIWKPNREYTVNIGTLAKVYKDGTTLLASYPENHTVKFRTEGPPGFFHKFLNNTLHPAFADLPEELRDKFKLRTLLHYIDFTTSYPNADGNLINAKPIFYEQVQLGLFFKQAYIRTMYDANWGDYQLGLKIKDPAKPAEDADVTYAQWVDGPVIESTENTVINDILGDVECLGINSVQTLSQGSVFVKDLEPLKCYTAVFNAFKGTEEREVHRYTFETSRYASFVEQVNDYVIIDEDEDNATTEAVFLIEKDWSGVSIPASDPDDVLAYERAVFTTLGLADLPPATTTEFLILKDAGSSAVVGVLVRNPEPFNDPKIAVSILEEGIDLTVNGASLSTKIVAKDASAILFPGGGNFPTTGAINIAAVFRYKLYNPDLGVYENAVIENVVINKQI